MYWVFLTVFINANQIGVFITMLIVFYRLNGYVIIWEFIYHNDVCDGIPNKQTDCLFVIGAIL